MPTTNQDDTSYGSARTGRFSSVRDRAGGAGDKVTAGIEASPLIALAAGIVVGAVAGAVLPRTDRETELLGPMGSKIGHAAADAARAARDAGKQELGLSETKSPVELMVDKVVGAVSAAGTAASSAAASTVSGKQDA